MNENKMTIEGIHMMTQGWIVWNQKITSRWSCCVVMHWEYMEM